MTAIEPALPDSRRPALRKGLLVALAALLLVLALWLLRRELGHVHLVDVRRAIGQLPATSLALALLGTALSYLALTGFDVLALRYIGRPLPYRRVAAASFIATAVGHNLGLSMLSANAVRLRLYSAWGLSAAEVALMAGTVATTVGIGLVFAAGLAGVLEPAEAGALLHLGSGGAVALGGLLLGLVGAYVLLCTLRQRPLQVRHWQIPIPAPGLALRQIALAGADLTCAALALWALLPAGQAPGFLPFLGVYVLALVAGAASHVPGGVGVFETVLLLALPDVPRDSLLAAVLGYRCFYYLLPLGLAAALAGALAARERSARIRQSIETWRPVFAGLAPATTSAIVFVVGALLLFSGSLPAHGSRLRLLLGVLPLSSVEVSHLVASLVGLALLVLAQALYRRVHLAYRVTLLLLAAGAAASLLKGLDLPEAGLAGIAALLLWQGRAGFNRPAALAANVLTPAWLAAVGSVLAATVWLGLFSYKHVEYSNELWWQFALRGDAPRFLRATLAVMAGALGLLLWRFLRPAPPAPGPPDAQALAQAARVVAESPRADAALALLGDKRLLFDAAGDAFAMYQLRGNSWITMGGAVGPRPAAEALAWRLRELADHHGGRLVMYQIDADDLPLCLDMGLSAIKLGEAAVVDLRGFTLDGPRRRDLRQAHRRGLREGLQFECVASADVPALMPTLRAVSDAWLGGKQAREKGFSLGRFDAAYLAHFAVALIRHQGRVVAFANLWCGAGRQELSVDLMRHLPDAPPGVMDMLFIELMLWGSAAGYARFNLGMAPLAGLETHPLAPLWHRLGTVVFHQGEHFYNFQGLRAYKEKFDPQWEPRYLATRGGFGLPGVLLDVASLIGGGVVGIVAR